jgi:hypothetical protein
MVRIPSNVLVFANGKTDLYEAFIDYWKHYRSNQGAKNLNFDASMSFDEKENKINEAMKKEIMRVANIGDMSALPVEQWASHPVMQWASFAVVSALIDSVVPDSIIDSIGLFSEVRTGGFGDSFSFEIKPRDLFTVSLAGRGRRVANLQKQYNGSKTILPEPRMITVGVALHRVLAGKESLADFVGKSIRSMEYEMTKDCYTLFAATMDALSNTATTGLRVAGYTQDAITDLCGRVSAWSGAKAVVCGTQRAVANVLPSNSNYRYDIESPFVKIGYVQTAFGYDVLSIPQIPDWKVNFGTLIADNRLWILSPGSGKFIKLCIEGSTLSNTTGIYDAANLQQTSTLWKSWGVGVVSSSVAGIITL